MISFDDWQDKTIESANILRQIQQEVHAIVPEAEIIVYDSRKRENNYKAIDWDFLILVDEPIDRKLLTEIRDRLYFLEMETDTILNSTVQNRQDWHSEHNSILPLKRIVEQKGIVL